jgi:O-acetyl-ADP-ribose deacetylase (regulator of RNase III)
MIAYKQGDLVAAYAAGEVEAIAHQANCQNTMNSGVAKAIREVYPEAYEADCQTIKGDTSKLGSLTFVITPVASHAHGFIFNLYGQFYYGREKGVQYTDLEALDNAFGQMRVCLDAVGVTSLGLPRIGCGTGGADWADVEEIIERHTDGIDVTIYTL